MLYLLYRNENKRGSLGLPRDPLSNLSCYQVRLSYLIYSPTEIQLLDERGYLSNLPSFLTLLSCSVSSLYYLFLKNVVYVPKATTFILLPNRCKKVFVGLFICLKFLFLYTLSNAQSFLCKVKFLVFRKKDIAHLRHSLYLTWKSF